MYRKPEQFVPKTFIEQSINDAELGDFIGQWDDGGYQLFDQRI
jgi:hypothetical protein